MDAAQEALQAWVDSVGTLDAESSAFVAKPATGACGVAVDFEVGVEGTAEMVVELFVCFDEVEQILVEPKLGACMEWGVTVVQAPGGGVIALPPTSTEIVGASLLCLLLLWAC